MSLKIFITYLFSFFSVAAFLGVTSGFTIYTHYCTDTSIINHSLLESQIECNHKTIETTHEVHDMQSSCTSHCTIESQSDECCTDNEQFYKISDVFNLTSPPEEEIFKHSYAVISAFILLNLEIEDFYKESVFTFSLPPPLSGKQIVLLYHQLKIVPDLIA